MSLPPLPSPPAIVINADDLGISPEVNQAIVASLERGLVTSTTIMANMSWFVDACGAVLERRLHDRVGVHLNLTEGTPLSDPIRSCARLCNPEGRLRFPRWPLWHLTREETAAVETELRAQVDAVLASGIRPSHFDSHHHVHTQWPIATIVMRMARRYGVPAIRLTRNCGPSRGLTTRAYKRVLNARFARAGFAATRHFGSASDISSLVEFSGPVEIMVHPSLDDQGWLIDRTDGFRLEDVLSDWRDADRLVTYRQLEVKSRARPER
jgi:chitin disaccharide deacetylase